MAAKVSFGAYTLMSDGEGNFSFMPGVFPRRGRDFVQLGRSESLLMRELSTPGCVHTVELRYYGADVDAVRNVLENAYNSGIGTLRIRGHNNIPNCAMIAPPVFGPGTYSRHLGSSVGGKAVVVSVSFQQVAA